MMIQIKRRSQFSRCSLNIFFMLCRHLGSSHVFEFDVDIGGVANDASLMIQYHNTRKFSEALQLDLPFKTIIFPREKTFYFQHGVYSNATESTRIQIDGTLKFERDFDENLKGNSFSIDGFDEPFPCIHIENSRNITFTSGLPESTGNSKLRGIIDGGGPAWWGIPGIGYAVLGEHRPNLLLTNRTREVLIENLVLRDSPKYTMLHDDVNGLVVRHTSIVSRRTEKQKHGPLDLSAFNTDGIDVAGHNVHVHDVDIWTQDDCIAVKDNLFPMDGKKVSSNMTFERVNASGLGLTIGSIGLTTVTNITFRDSTIYKGVKGVYMKFRLDFSGENQTGLIENILYENITMFEPSQWAIWIGPAQQVGEDPTANFCRARPCSLCWPIIPGTECFGIKSGLYRNIVLKNIDIINPPYSPGVIIADETNPIQGIVFDNVAVSTKSNNEDPNVAEMFPGLSLVPQDKYVKRFKFALGGVVMALFSICFVVPILRCSKQSKKWLQTSHRRNTYSILNDFWFHENIDIPRNINQRSFWAFSNPNRCQLVLFCITIMICLCLIYFGVIYPVGIETVNDYFKCEGVIGGIVKGSTYPVPSCFENSEAKISHERLLNYNARTKDLKILTIVIILVFVSLVRICGKNFINHFPNFSKDKNTDCLDNESSNKSYDNLCCEPFGRQRTLTDDTYDSLNGDDYPLQLELTEY